jgi:hypothetical protein
MTRRSARRFNILTKEVKHLMCSNRRVKYVGFRSNPVSAVYVLPAAAVSKEEEEEPQRAFVGKQQDLPHELLRDTACDDPTPNEDRSSIAEAQETSPPAMAKQGNEQWPKHGSCGNSGGWSASDNDTEDARDDGTAATATTTATTGSSSHHQQVKKTREGASSTCTTWSQQEKNLRLRRLSSQTVCKLTAAAEQGEETPLVNSMWDVADPRRV